MEWVEIIALELSEQAAVVRLGSDIKSGHCKWKDVSEEYFYDQQHNCQMHHFDLYQNSFSHSLNQEGWTLFLFATRPVSNCLTGAGKA